LPHKVFGQLNSALHLIENAEARLLRIEHELAGSASGSGSGSASGSGSGSASGSGSGSTSGSGSGSASGSSSGSSIQQTLQALEAALAQAASDLSHLSPQQLARDVVFQELNTLTGIEHQLTSLFV